MLFICFSVFEEYPQLREHILAARRAAPHAEVVVVDGAFEAFPHESHVSQDGTLDIAYELAEHVIECRRAWVNEETKRSQYFIGGEGDSYLVVDGDEEVIGAVPTVVAATDASVLLKRTNGCAPYSVFRYHKHGEGLRYYGQHNGVHRGAHYVRRNECPTLRGFYLLHKFGVRGQEREERDGIYTSWLADHEYAFRKIKRDA